MSDALGKSVCVIGAGATGLVALKNLREEGFEATAYERNGHIGGLWHVSADTTQTTALSGTIANASKYTACYSDYPFADNVSLFPTAKEIQGYLESYATHFDLWRHIKLFTSVDKIEREEQNRKWVVTSSSGGSQTQSLAFDRLILATGGNAKPVFPRFPNAEVFEGEILHSQQFKDPLKYKERTVVVVGSGQTAADTVDFLRTAGAKKLYLSHRRSFLLLPRMLAGNPTESVATRRFFVDGARERARDPGAADEVAERNLRSLQDAIWPALKDSPAFAASRERPLMQASLPVVSDSLADNLIGGAVESVQAIDHVGGSRSVVLKDGTSINDVDAIVICSGNSFDFGSALLPRQFDPTNSALASEQYSALESAQYFQAGMELPRAYRRFLSVQEPHSLAFLGHAVSKTTIGLFAFYDLMSMALVQLWKGTTMMPIRRDMEEECDQYFTSLARMLSRSELNHTGIVPELAYDDWLHKTAGTGVADEGCEKSKLSLTNRRLYDLLMDGFNSPHMMRLFHGNKRRAWDGAQAAIEKVNRNVEEGAGSR